MFIDYCLPTLSNKTLIIMFFCLCWQKTYHVTDLRNENLNVMSYDYFRKYQFSRLCDECCTYIEQILISSANYFIFLMDENKLCLFIHLFLNRHINRQNQHPMLNSILYHSEYSTPHMILIVLTILPIRYELFP